MAGNAKKSQQLKDRDKEEQAIKNKFSDRLEDLLTEREVKAKDLAKSIGVSVGILTGYKNAINAPSVSKLKKIADFFGVSTDYLLGESECKAPHDEEIHNITGLSEEAIRALKLMAAADRRVDDLKATDEKFKDFTHLHDEVFSSINYLITGGQGLLVKIHEYLYREYDVQVFDVGDITGEETRLAKLPGVSVRNSKTPTAPGSYFNVSELNEMFLVQIQKYLIELRNEIQSKDDK